MVSSFYGIDAITASGIERIEVARGPAASLAAPEAVSGTINIMTKRANRNGVSIDSAVGEHGHRKRSAVATGVSAAWTQLNDAAFITDEGFDRPTLLNADESFQVAAFDLTGSYQLTPMVTVSATGEVIRYEDSYQETFVVAPLEERVRLEVDATPGRWDLHAGAMWMGGRDLADYGYEGFNVRAEDGTLSRPKTLTAPDYILLDPRAERAVGRRWSFYAGANHLLDYNPADDEETPLFWDGRGGYDVAHIYEPLRGRVIYGGIRFEL